MRGDSFALEPAVKTPPARSRAGTTGQETVRGVYSGGGGGGGGDGGVVVFSGISGISPTAAAAALSAPTTRLPPTAVDYVDLPPRSALPPSPFPVPPWYTTPWRSRGRGISGGGGGGGGGEDSVAAKEERRVAGGAAAQASTYHCQICLDDRPAGDGFVLSACGHTFCRTCLKAYITSKVHTSEVYPKCFHVMEECHTALEERRGAAGADAAAEAEATGRCRAERGGEVRLGRDGRGGGGAGAGAGGWGQRGSGARPEGCGVVVHPTDIKELLKDDKGMSRKYTRFLFFREHKTARECPRCSSLSVGDPLTSSEMRCSGCAAVFCYEHGGAHEGRSCAEYIESTADETHRTMALIGRLTKKCPGCQAPVEKLGGCNQMVCLHCHCSFCWICMEQVDRGTFPVHFQWWNVRGCPNQQLQEDAERSEGGRQCLKALSVLQIIVVGPLALLLTVASSLACVCCLPAFKLPPRQLFTGCISGWGNFIMVLPLLPFVFAGAVIAGVVYILTLPSRIFAAVSRKCRSWKRRVTMPNRPTSGNSASNSGSDGVEGGTEGSGSGSGSAGVGEGGDPCSLESGTIGTAGIEAADADVESGSGASEFRVPVPPAATAAAEVSTATKPSAGAMSSTRGTFAEVLGAQRGSRQMPPPLQLLPEWREEEQLQGEQRKRREEERGRDEEAEVEKGLPCSSKLLPPERHNVGVGGCGGALGDGVVLPQSALPRDSPMSPAAPRPFPRSSVVAVPATVKNSSSRRSEGSGGGGSGGDGETFATPPSHLGARQTGGARLGASPLPAMVSSSSYAAGAAALSLTAGVRAAALRDDISANADCDGGDEEHEGIRHDVSSKCSAGVGAAVNSNNTSAPAAAPFSLPVDREARTVFAAATAATATAGGKRNRGDCGRV